MISKFFIDRPVFASVISIIIVIGGLLAMRFLPISQYPEIVPPEVSVSATYPGASAETIASTVAAPLEQQVNGVEKMLYMRSTSTGSGTLSLVVTFAIGTNPDQATINVNNRVQRAIPLLPQEVQRQGVVVQKRSSSILEVVAMASPNRTYDTIFISNYALINIIDELRRTPGVGDASLFGAADYSMRIWLRPDKLAQYNLTPSDVAAAIREQNQQFAAGRFGEEPQKSPPSFTYTVTTQGRLVEPKEFENIILRTDEFGGSLRVKDVARVELGSQNYAFSATFNGNPTVPIGIYLQPGANAIQVTKAVKDTMDRLAQRFPEDLKYEVPFTTTRFVEVSIEEVLKTFAEAIALVVLVIFLFLQNVRATIIPVIAMPVSIIGTFAGMYALGFSINLLTLFGLVLAIGIVVDDAIVVLENIERIMRTEHLRAREASVKAMSQVSGPIVAIVLTLCAVFIPVSFLGGLAGELYRQFAVTISVSVVISGLVALTLTPALAAIFLDKPHREPVAPFRVFNRGLAALTEVFSSVVGFFLRRTLRLGCASSLRCWRCHGGTVPARAGQPAARGRPGLQLPRHGAAAGRVARPHQGGRRQRRRRRAEEPGGQGHRRLRRLRHPVVGAEDQRRRRLRVAEGLVGAHRSRDGRAAHGPGVRRAERTVPRRLRDRLQSAADPGHQHHRRLRVLPAGPHRRLARLAVSGRQQDRRGRSASTGVARRQFAVLDCGSAVPDHRRPRQGEDARRAAELDLRHDAERTRQPVRQRLHPVRPHLPRQPVVGIRLPPLA